MLAHTARRTPCRRLEASLLRIPLMEHNATALGILDRRARLGALGLTPNFGGS